MGLRSGAGAGYVWIVTVSSQARTRSVGEGSFTRQSPVHLVYPKFWTVMLPPSPRTSSVSKFSKILRALLRRPYLRESRKSRGTLNIEYHAHRLLFLPLDRDFCFVARSEARERRLVTFQGNFRIAIEDRLQLVTIERVRRGGLSSADADGELLSRPFYGKRFDRAGLISQRRPRWLSSSVEVHNAVHALLHDASALVSDVRAVIVVAEENQSADIFLLAKDAVVFAQNFDAPGISLGPFRRAGAIAIFRYYDGLAGKCLVDLFHIAAKIVGSAFIPTFVVFVPFHKIHESGDVF